MAHSLRQNILIASNVSSTRRSLVAKLKRMGYQAETVTNSEEMIQKIKGKRYNFVFIDVKITKEKGILEQITGLSRGIIPIVITAYHDISTAQMAVARGVWDYIVSPFRPRYIKFVIDRAFNRWMTDQKHRLVEADLKFLKELSESIVKEIPTSILIFSEGFKLIYANENFYKKTDKKAGDLQGRRIDSVFPKRMVKDLRLDEKVADVLKTGRPFEGELMAWRSGGIKRYYFYKISPLKGIDEGSNRAMILMEDLTKTRELSDEIALLKEHYAGVISSIPSYLLTVNRKLQLVSANKAFCEVNGEKESDLVGKHISEIFPAEMARHASLEESLRKVITSGESQVMKELEYNTPRQGTKIINGRVICMSRNHERNTGNGGDAKILLIMDDITERVRIGESLRKVQELSTRVIEGIPVGIEVIDKDMIIRGWNEGMQRIFGHRAEEVVGKNIFDFFPQLINEIGGEAFQKVLTTGEVVTIDNFRYESEKKGMEFLNIKYAPLKEKGLPSGIVGIIEDVTAKKELELEACRQERLSVIGQLAAGVAHELNNPLSIICGNIEVLMKNLEKAEIHKEELEVIRRELERCRGLAQNLLNLSRQSEPVIQRVDVNGLIKEILHLMRSEIKFKKIAVETSLSSRLRPIMADESQLEQVFMNLILNASQAMPNGGRLRMTTQNAHHGRAIRIRFDDNGVGIPREDLNKIFTPFYTSKGQKNGTGLGLTITKQIIESHKGWIKVRSRVGEGTTFFIELPAISEEGDVPKDRSPG